MLLIGILGLVAAVFVLWRSDRSPQAPRGTGQIPIGDGGTLPEAPRLLGKQPDRARGPDEIAIPPGSNGQRPLVVRVRMDSTDDPVVGARVRIVRADLAELQVGAVDGSTCVAAGITGGDGLVDLRLRDLAISGGHWVVLVDPSGPYASTSATLKPGQSTVTLTVTRGASLHGRVIDGRGQGVPGLELEARHCCLGPPANPGIELVPLEGRCIRRTKADASGFFAFEGLPSGAYDIWPVTSGWTVAYRTPWPRARTGASDARIVVYRARLFRFRLLDAETKAPLTSVVRSTHVLFGSDDGEAPGGGDLTPSYVHTGSGWVRIGDTNPADGLMSGLAWFSDGQREPPSTARLLIQADGYGTVNARVTLLAPEEYVSGQDVDLIHMVRSGSSPLGSVVVRCNWDVANGMAPGPGTRLILMNPRVVLHGTRSADGMWCFDGVPVGTHEVAYLSDGLGLSRPFTVEVGGIATIGGSARFVRPTGIRLDVRDPAGLRVFRLEDVMVQGTTLDGKMFTSRMPYGSLVSAGRRAAEAPAYPIPPGEYVVRVVKSGYISPLHEIDVTFGKVSVCRIDLAAGAHARK